VKTPENAEGVPEAEAEGVLEASVAGLLRDLHLLDDERAEVEPAGDGNINWVRRVRSRASGRSVIVKHARPALEKFPEYRTSTERIVFENRWFEIARRHDPEHVCPTILHFDSARRLLVLEDLGDAERLDAALLRGADVDEALRRLAAFLGRVHAATRDDERLVADFQNEDIQGLHGDHIFELPYTEDFPVPDGVEARARAVRGDASIREIAARAYERYRTPRGALVHGDVQPGNVLLGPEGPVLLDAEIAHVGDPAFDVGTLLAHVWLAGLAAPRAAHGAARARSIWSAYGAGAGGDTSVSFEDVSRYAGLEMMRRTIGAARVAAVAGAETSRAAIDAAERLVRHPPTAPEEMAVP
jgi:5-methylthioribose kinase